jgi:hypothetical protein
MGSFWPSNLEISDMASPIEILETAAEEWCNRSDGQLLLKLKQGNSDEGHPMISVVAEYVPKKRTATLFEVLHRSGAPYPVSIQPKGSDLPNFLKKSYLETGLGGASWAAVASQVFGTEGRRVKNDWVAETPLEFREKLQKVFNLGTTKSEIQNLVSGAASPSGSGEDEVQQDVTKEE